MPFFFCLGILHCVNCVSILQTSPSNSHHYFLSTSYWLCLLAQGGFYLINTVFQFTVWLNILQCSILCIYIKGCSFVFLWYFWVCRPMHLFLLPTLGLCPLSILYTLFSFLIKIDFLSDNTCWPVSPPYTSSHLPHPIPLQNRTGLQETGVKWNKTKYHKTRQNPSF